MGVQVEKRERAIMVRFDRPPLNVLDVSLLRQLGEALTSCAREGSADVVALRGNGGRAFSAGVDIKDHTPDKAAAMLEVVHGVIRQLFALPQVTIAVIDGLCLGGGCELASSCDILVASDDSSFATPEIRVGCYPPVALARFPGLIGYHRAAEMILTGRRFTAQEALSLGLVNRVFPKTELDKAFEVLLDELRGNSGAVMRTTIRGLRELSLKGFSQDLEISEAIYRDELLSTRDAAEGIQAFLDKREPRWSHR